MKVAQSCLTLCDIMDYTVRGILQARTLEWVAIPFSRGSSQPRDWTQVSHIACRLFTSWANEQGCINHGKDFIFYLMFNRKPLKNFKWSTGMIWCTFQMTHYSDCCLWTGLGRRTGNWRLLLETIIRWNWIPLWRLFWWLNLEGAVELEGEKVEEWLFFCLHHF